MSVQTTPHVNFPGTARDALAFYQSVFGGDLMLATYGDIGAVEDPAKANDIAFGRVTAPNGFDIMAYDVQPSKAYDPGQNPFYITMQSDNEAEVRASWKALATEARAVLTPLGPADFAPLYGMLTDRYGVTWIVGADTAPGSI